MSWTPATKRGAIPMQRRDLLKTVGGVTAAGIAGGAGAAALAGTGAAAQLDNLTVTGSTITTDDGTIDDATVTVDGLGEYDGVDEEVTSVEFIVEAFVPGTIGSGEYETVATKSFAVSDHASLGSSAGSIEFTGLGGSLLDNTGYTAEDFEASDDGSKNQREVDFRLTFNVKSNGTTVIQAQETNAAVYTVENEESSASAGGDGSTSMDGENQDP